MRKVLTAAKYLLVAGYLLCGVALAVFLLPKTGWRALNILTGSMRPAVPQGSLVIIHNVPTRDIHPGDVITFINPVNAKQTITHRVVETKTVASLPGFVTRGDANNSDDQPILAGNVVGKVVWHAPNIGHWLNTARKPIWVILLVAIPGILIIIDELRILVHTLSREEIKQASEPPASQSITLAQTEPKPKAKSPPKRRSMDGMVKRAVLLVMLATLTIGGTKSQLVSNSVQLTNNSFSTFTPANHLVIQRVSLHGPLSCPLAGNDTIVITNTAPGSVNQASINNNCVLILNSSTTIVVNNSNNQTATTGNASGNDATSGDASNSNTTNTSINIGPSDPLAGVELYNPTSQPIVLTGWSLTDNSGVTQPLLITMTLQPHQSVGVLFAGVLTGTGDRLILKDPATTTVDAISWGSDTSQLNPSIPAFTNAIVRRALGLDTDSASDWQVIP